MESFVFEASWDDEAKVSWVSKTPISGLVTEAETIDELGIVDLFTQRIMELPT